MPDIPSAHIHRLDGHTVTPPRIWTIPGLGLMRFVIGVWPATLALAATATVVVSNAL